MASILQSIMEPHSPFKTRKSLAKSPFIKASVIKSSVTEFSIIESSVIEFSINESSLSNSITKTSQPKNNRAVNYSTAARIQAFTLAKRLQTLTSMEKDIVVKIAAAQSNIRKKTVLRYMRTTRL